MRYATLLLAALFAVACASTNATMLGTAPSGLSSLAADSVQVYSDTASVVCPYKRVAFLSTSGTVQGMDERMMKSAKKKAGEVGANAMVIGSLDSQGPSFGDAYGNTEGRFLAILEDRPCK